LYHHDTLRALDRKLVEDSLGARVNDAREALAAVKEFFVGACPIENYDPELEREVEIMAIRVQVLAMETLLAALIDFNSFILGGMVSEHLPPQSPGQGVPGGRVIVSPERPK
jgi:hypothetical protein